MIHLETLLNELSFILPDVSVANINMLELMEFDLHNLPDQFKKDLIYTSFFSMLEVEINHKLIKEENEWQDLENALSEDIRANGVNGVMEKMTESRLKILVQLDNRWASKRNAIAQLKYQLDSVRAVVKDLSRKGIALNVLTAKSKAEIGAGIQH